MTTKSAFRARHMLASPLSVFLGPYSHGPVLPMPDNDGNINRTRAVIRWMSDKKGWRVLLICKRARRNGAGGTGTHVMKIAITGARGFIGRHLTKFLTERGCVVVPINRDDWDLTSQSSPATLINDCDAVVHLAARVHVRGQAGDDQFVKTMVETNVVGRSGWRAPQRDQGATRFVFMSSAAVFARGIGAAVIDEDTPLRPETPYGQSKLAAEEALQAIAKDAGLVSVALHRLVYGAARQAISGRSSGWHREACRSRPAP